MRNNSISQIYRESRYAQNTFIHFLRHRLKNVKKHKNQILISLCYNALPHKTNITVRFPSYFFATTFYHRKQALHYFAFNSFIACIAFSA